MSEERLGYHTDPDFIGPRLPLIVRVPVHVNSFSFGELLKLIEELALALEECKRVLVAVSTDNVGTGHDVEVIDAAQTAARALKNAERAR